MGMEKVRSPTLQRAVHDQTLINPSSAVWGFLWGSSSHSIAFWMLPALKRPSRHSDFFLCILSPIQKGYWKYSATVVSMCHCHQPVGKMRYHSICELGGVNQAKVCQQASIISPSPRYSSPMILLKAFPQTLYCVRYYIPSSFISLN